MGRGEGIVFLLMQEMGLAWASLSGGVVVLVLKVLLARHLIVRESELDLDLLKGEPLLEEEEPAPDEPPPTTVFLVQIMS